MPILWSNDIDPEDPFRLCFQVGYDKDSDTYYLGGEDNIFYYLNRKEFKELMYAMMRHHGLINVSDLMK